MKQTGSALTFLRRGCVIHILILLGMYMDFNVPSYDTAVHFKRLSLVLRHNLCNSEGATDDLCNCVYSWNSAHYYIFANDPGDHIVL